MEPGKHGSAAREPSDQLEGATKLWDGSMEYCGTKEALIAAGAALPEWFPDGEKPWLASRTISNHNGRKIRLEKRPSGSFRVIHCSTPEEYGEAWERRKREHDAQEKARRAQKEIDEMPGSADAFRAAAFRSVDCSLYHLVYAPLHTPNGGFVFSRATLDAIDMRIAELREAIKSGEVVFSRDGRAEEVTRLRAKALGESPDFERFMAKTMGERTEGKPGETT